MSVFEWLGRVIMLVLAGMITLSIIGAIAAIPSGSNLPRQIGFDRSLQHELPQRVEPVPSETAVEPATPSEPETAAQAGSAAPAPAPAQPEPADPAEWLEVIAYALLALAGLAALGILLLWRLLSQQSRIADALEQSRSRAS
jgi:hypothetical protein